MTSQFGVLLRRWRLRAEMTQERLAERAGVGVRTIRGFETGERADPRVVTVRLLADALELTPEERDELLAAAAGSPQSDVVKPDQPPITRPVSVLRDTLTEAAEQLAQAVGTRWLREEEQRQVQDPFPLPVRWRAAPEEVTDHWANICRVRPGGTSVPLDLAGRLDEIAEVYRRIPSGRLVVLGRAGSGKTILTLRFVLDFLKARAHTEVVPVIFGLGSWNPTTTSLRDWLTDHLVRDHPGLATAGPGTSTLAAALIDDGRVLPVLDGFDEIARGLHGAALEALNATTLPLVLTSRPAEYAAAVAGTDVLTSAAGIELADLTVTDLVDYLPRTTRKSAGSPARTVWDPVLAQLRAHPERAASVNLAAVLTTPLMVVLARAIYSDTPDRDPSALLDTDRFGTQEALEDHLLDSFVPTVYRRQPGRRHWDVDRVQHWLGYLAAHLDRLGTRDLAWWQMGTTIRRTSRLLLVGAVAGAAISFVVSLVSGLVYWLVLGLGFARGFGYGLTDGLVAGPIVGLAFGLAHGLMAVFRGRALEPSRVQVRILGTTRQTWGRFLPRFRVGLGAGLLFGVGYALMGGVVNQLQYGQGDWLTPGLINAVVFGLVFGFGAGLVFGFMATLETPLDLRSAVSPIGLLNTNRRTVSIQLFVWAPAFGLLVVIGGLLCVALLQGLLGPLVFGLPGALVWGIGGGLGGGLGYVFSLTAWGQWVVFSRIWLPLTGRLPWPVIAFLDDAYQRGVLRQAGAVYQFRHARLQDRLTTCSVPATDVSAQPRP